MKKILLAAFLVAAAAWPVRAQEHEAEMSAGHSHEQCELHGGTVTMSEAHHFETVFTPDGIRVYIYTDQQLPASTDGVSGTAVLKSGDGASVTAPLAPEVMKKGAKAVWFCPMHPDVVRKASGKCPGCKMKLVPQAALFAAVDLSMAVAGSLKATIEVKGMEGMEAEVTFTETFHGFVPAEKAHDHGAHEHTGSGQPEHQGH